MLNKERLFRLMPDAMVAPYCLDSVESTNELVKADIDAGKDEGVLYTALEQTGGYGRQGRTWLSPEGGLYFSMLLKPDVPAFRLPAFGPVASMALEAALALFSLPQTMSIKWPNDILASGGKLCGISLETHGDALCLGVGINVFHPAQQVDVEGKNTPAYLCDIADRGLDSVFETPADNVDGAGVSLEQQRTLESVLAACVESVVAHYVVWRQDGFRVFHQSYNALLEGVGEQVAVQTIDGETTLEGAIEGVDTLGGLIIALPDGSQQIVNSGEVHIL